MLKQWIKVGNYWIDKKYHSNSAPLSVPHIQFTPPYESKSPLKVSESSAHSDAKEENYNFEYSFKQSPNNPSPLRSSPSNNQSISSTTLNKMERIKALLSSVNVGDPSPAPSM